MSLTRTKLTRLDAVFVVILAIIFGGVVLHAPLSVAFGTVFPDYLLLVKAWKEILLGVASVLAVIVVYRHRAWGLYRSPLFYAIAAFAGLHLLLIPLSFTGPVSTIAGLLIDLRYILLFVLIFTAVSLYPQLRRTFVITGIVGALIVTAFAILQVTVLPHDVLKYLGYSNATIAPFLTVDQNIEYIRINSTLRGPNPLGAYALIVLSLLIAYWLRGNHSKTRHPMGVALMLLIGGAIALWASYSRSALLGAVVAVGVILLITVGGRLSKAVWIALAVVALTVGGSLVAFKDSDFVSHVILHEDPQEGNDVNSNDGHLESLVKGVQMAITQPFGTGIGSTGSASILSNSTNIIENHYLFIAHETGWIGLGLFLFIFITMLQTLWKRRRDWLALGVFASGIGLSVVALLLPVWADDTVSLVWWGFAAVAIATTGRVKAKQKS